MGGALFVSATSSLAIVVTEPFQEGAGKARGHHVPTDEGQASGDGLRQRFLLRRIHHCLSNLLTGLSLN